MLRICFAPRVAVERARNLEAYVSRSLGFSHKGGTHVMAVASSTGGWRPSVQARSHQHRRTDEARNSFRWKNGEEKTTREKILVQFWTSYVREEFDLANSSQRKAAFSCATAIMDRVCGWRF